MGPSVTSKVLFAVTLGPIVLTRAFHLSTCIFVYYIRIPMKLNVSRSTLTGWSYHHEFSSRTATDQAIMTNVAVRNRNRGIRSNPLPAVHDVNPRHVRAANVLCPSSSVNRPPYPLCVLWASSQPTSFAAENKFKFKFKFISFFSNRTQINKVYAKGMGIY